MADVVKMSTQIFDVVIDLRKTDNLTYNYLYTCGLTYNYPTLHSPTTTLHLYLTYNYPTPVPHLQLPYTCTSPTTTLHLYLTFNYPTPVPHLQLSYTCTSPSTILHLYVTYNYPTPVPHLQLSYTCTSPSTILHLYVTYIYSGNTIRIAAIMLLYSLTACPVHNVSLTAPTGPRNLTQLEK
ncbi:hypothetical protein Hamer_G009247 [Homarus americanus]|uniref:Uncharacterized protein n=1 Tax=Homarus americanus TaxID=6706 RepID=A0A8J5MJK8_HOMAM|nr:hypothetical protein Hamer_G009247 [Homarus americanus]